jgi:protoheme IX farnesyltransferase
VSAESFSTAQIEQEPALRDWWRLLKPRVMSLVVFTALVGLIAAPGGAHPVIALAAVLCIAVGAGASGALNQWWDADIDAAMKRTAQRPVPAGRIEPGEALGFGVGLSILSVLTLAVVANPLAAALLAFTIFFYAVVYTMWLKRSTPQNIVIGGLAGAMPPLVGWAAATGEIAVAPLLMVLVIFLWTPPHFWALSLWIEDDYRAARVPMMSIAQGERAARVGIFGYALATGGAAGALALSHAGGPITAAAALGLSGWFALCALRVRGRDRAAATADRFRAEKRLFGVSILYLFGLFGAVAADAALGPVAGWPVLF